MPPRQVKAPVGTRAATTGSQPKPKYVPKQSKPTAPLEQRLPKLYRSLADQIDDGYMTNAIKTCRKILSLDPKSDAAFKTLLFLLLETDAYAPALELVESTIAAQSRGNLEFEKAYCLYRLHKEEESLKIVESVKGTARSGEDKAKWEHLEAQINYRLGSYQAAQHIFEDLLATCASDSTEYPDLVTNLNATSQRLDFTNSGFHSYAATASIDDLESNVPTLPAGWSSRPIVPVSKAPVASSSTAKAAPPPKKPKHALPKGAKPGSTFTEDPDRWLPYKQRASTAAAINAASSAGKKKKGGKEGMGTGMTQGSTNDAPASSQSGGNKKKGKKGR